jgi:hypothetical protein
MKIIAEQDFCGIMGNCIVCGSPVAHYTCNDPLIAVRDEAQDWDWWASCTNEKCSHHYGQGVFQNKINWVTE